MVKNTGGGNKAKGQARKGFSKGGGGKLRVITEEGEVYAVVTKMTGGGFCNVHCSDDVKRICVIRGKFTGRNMRDNIIGIGTWVMVGIRGWESSDKKDAIPKCDLLEIYSAIDKERLQNAVVNIDWKVLLNNAGTGNGVVVAAETNVVFMDRTEEEYLSTMAKVLLDKTSASTAIAFDTDDTQQVDNVGWDDI